MTHHLTVGELLHQKYLEKKGATIYPIKIQFTVNDTQEEFVEITHVYAESVEDAEELRTKIAYRIAEEKLSEIDDMSYGLVMPKSRRFKKRYILSGMFWKDPMWQRSVKKGWAPQGIKPFSLLAGTYKDITNKKKSKIKELKKPPLERVKRFVIYHLISYLVGFAFSAAVLVRGLIQETTEAGVPFIIFGVLTGAMFLAAIAKTLSDHKKIQGEDY